MAERLDKYLVTRGFFESREKAQTAIREGLVLVNGVAVAKPSMGVGEHDEVTVQGTALHYVSRGGLKLEKAIREFGLDLAGKTVLDIGASTGGFTDCALQHGARKVFAVDVGTGQLHPRLREDPRVVSFEGLHIRDLNAGHLDHRQADLILIDVSFISLRHVFPFLRPFLAEGGLVIALIKPQFELEGKMRLKKGILKDEALRWRIVRQVGEYAQQAGFRLAQLTATDADGLEKNIEYLACLAPV